MKTKYILLIAALAVCFASCEKQEPYDTQSADDAPLILQPYSESLTGSFVYSLKDENTPLVDSVIVTPSAYTTVNWYVDSVLVNTGTKINMCFAKGTHDLLIEAVTTAGKRTTRTGLILVDPHVLWSGPKNLEWNADVCKVTKTQLADVPVGARIIIFFELLESETSFQMRVTTPSWGDNGLEDDLVLQQKMDDASSPFIFTYDERCKKLVDGRGAMSVVGEGLKINNIITDK